MINYRNASLEDREDFAGMNDFQMWQPPLIADITVDGNSAKVTVAEDDNNRFRIEITMEATFGSLAGHTSATAMDTKPMALVASLVGETAAFAMVAITETTTAHDLNQLGFVFFHDAI
jgi:hypothetical protein